MSAFGGKEDIRVYDDQSALGSSHTRRPSAPAAQTRLETQPRARRACPTFMEQHTNNYGNGRLLRVYTKLRFVWFDRWWRGDRGMNCAFDRVSRYAK